MCSGPEQFISETCLSSSPDKDMTGPIKAIESDVSFSNLLELAANDDVEGFKRLVTRIASAINEVGLWYGRERSSKRMLMEHRTPLMIASTYGSVDVVKLILSLSEADVNQICGPDKTTALHCAASSGSANAFDVIKLLFMAGADPQLVDANGCRPIDVLVAPPNVPGLKSSLEKLLQNNGSGVDQEDDGMRVPCIGLTSSKSNDGNLYTSSEKKEYPCDPSFPDINSGMYSTDEFRMFSFKIRPCSRAYSHDWTECPFIHPGENARRRDPRKIHYSCVPCPDFRKGNCQRGDLCEYAHGVFECWLHPAQYRTRLCKDGTGCSRRVCFFAHTPEELRPLYVSTGSAIPSPQGSPSAMSAVLQPPFSPPPMLHLPGGNLQSSRLRLSFNARDIPTEELNMLLDFEMHHHQQQQKVFSDMPSVFSPSYKSVVLNRLSPMNMNMNLYSPRGNEHLPMQGSYTVPSPRVMSPRGMEQPQSLPFSPPLPGFYGSPAKSMSNWESEKRKVDWSFNGDDLARATWSMSNGHSVIEPDVSWVQSLVKEPPTQALADGSEMEPPEIEKKDHAVLGAWLEKMQLDQIVA